MDRVCQYHSKSSQSSVEKAATQNVDNGASEMPISEATFPLLSAAIRRGPASRRFNHFAHPGGGITAECSDPAHSPGALLRRWPFRTGERSGVQRVVVWGNRGESAGPPWRLATIFRGIQNEAATKWAAGLIDFSCAPRPCAWKRCSVIPLP
jgi:hypothetical protein